MKTLRIAPRAVPALRVMHAIRAACGLRGLLALVCVTAAWCAQAQMAAVGDGGPGPVKAQHLTAELVSLGPAIAPGGTQAVGLVLTMDEHWHVYWINPGDSGEPPKILWTLPTGITAGQMQFPVPERLPLGPLMDFGYEDEVAFPVMVSASAASKPGPVHLDAQVSWLVCAQVCIPGKAHLGLELTVTPGAAQEPLLGALGEAITLIPKPLPARMKFSVQGDAKRFALTLIDGTKEQDAEFYPLDSNSTDKGPTDKNPTDKGPTDKDSTDVIANAADQNIEHRSDGLRLLVLRSPDSAALPATLHGVLKLSDTESYEVSAPVTPVTSVLPVAQQTQRGTVLEAIGLAFVGGLILNLMPCVFPVLFLKGLALVHAAGPAHSDPDARSHLRKSGLVYAAGIVVSFWAIVAVLLILRAGGSHAGWGFQLQSPGFLAVLASLIFFLALSLAGQFEIGLSLTSVGGSLVDKPGGSLAGEPGGDRQGYASSFFTGVLATVVATPCTAPLMGAAIGFALTQSAAVTFAVFTALALGLAAPYLLLCWQPAWARLLPRPGAWTEIFKQAAAAIFFATTIWLAWVYGQLFPVGDGVNQVALLLGCFLLLAVAGWALGRWPARWSSGIAAVILISLALAIPLSQVRGRAPLSGAAVAEIDADDPGKQADIAWQPYSEQALNRARAAGHPVFIDFTAAWCLSCQFNERAVLNSVEVKNALMKGDVTTFKADWTNSDPEITKKLASVGRAGVPTYVLYPTNLGSAADVLPELLTKDLVLKAIERDAK